VVYRVQRSEQFPKISGSAGASLTGSPDGRGATLETESYSVGLGLSAFEIDLFGRLRSLSRAALEQYFASEYGSRATRVSLIAETASAWLTLAADQERLRIARATQAAAQESVTLNRQRLEGGISSQLEVSQAETILQQARADAAAYATLVEQDRNALQLLVGAPVAEDLTADRLDDAYVVAKVAPGLNSEVLLARPDVMQTESLLRSANANIGAARAAFFPRISLTATAGVASAALDNLFRSGSFAYTASPSAALPIFDGGANRANLAGSRAQRDAALAQYEQSIQVAFRDVADALARQGTMAEQLDAAQRLASSANSGAQVSMARYRSGADTYLSALDAQRTLYAAQQSLVSTQLTQATNRVTLYRVLAAE
jgi:outer membrane protein, multidrug efflux system